MRIRFALLSALVACAACRSASGPELPLLPGGPPTEAPTPVQWIWVAGGVVDAQTACFARAFEVDGAPRAARLEGSCDDAFEVQLNGARVLWGEEWRQPVFADVLLHLRPGPNQLTVLAHNAGGPAGLQLALIWQDAGGREQRLVSDVDWRAASPPPENWGSGKFALDGLAPALELAVLGAEPWGALLPAVAPAREDALPAEEVQVAPGYAVERLYSVPRASQGSWVALTFDARGRALASAERGGLYRITLPGSAGGEVSVEQIDDRLGGAQGLLALGSDLYMVCAPRDELQSGLWRLRDADGDDHYETRELLLPLEGQGEHGPHAVIQDGERLLLVAGNHTRLPDGIARSRVPRTWDEDQLLPSREDPGGHAWGIPAPGGYVLSLDRDGGDVELVASGLRNAYDIALGPERELFGYDSDMEWDVGLPWYRAPRVVHLVSGCDFGWRRGSGKWPADWPDSLPSAVDTDVASPTGVLSGAELTAFGARERSALLLADWAYGRVLALDLEPRGASWGGSVRPFLSGSPLAVTDLAAGPDGCLYFTTGGRNTHSGLYRVVPLEAQPNQPQAVWPGRAQRDRRRALEELHLAPDASALPEIWSALGEDDPFLRHAARVALEGLPVELWIERARSATDARVRAQAVIALAHAGDSARAGEAADLLAGCALEQLDDVALVDWLRALDLVELRLGGVPEPQRTVLRTRLEDIFPRGRERIDRELCRTLVALDSERVVPAALALLESSQSQEQGLFMAFALVEAGAGWDEGTRARFFAMVNSAPTRFAGGASLGGYLAGLRADAHQRLGLPADAPVVAAVPAPVPRPFVRAWSVAELERAGAELEGGRSLERGRAAYRDARCLDCHTLAGEGGRTGPDLTGAGARFNLRDLLEAVLEPSLAISDQYQDSEVLTVGDELLVGRVLGDDGRVLRLLAMPPDERVIEIALDEVAERRPHALSRMPAGLVDVLEREELLDLLAFLRAGGDPAATCFQVPQSAR